MKTVYLLLDVMNPFLRSYIDNFKYKTLVSEDFKQYLLKYFEGKVRSFLLVLFCCCFYYFWSNRNSKLAKNYTFDILNYWTCSNIKCCTSIQSVENVKYLQHRWHTVLIWTTLSVGSKMVLFLLALVFLRHFVLLFYNKTWTMYWK